MKKRPLYFLLLLIFVCSCVSVSTQDEDDFSLAFNQGNFKLAARVYDGTMDNLSFLQTINTATAAMIADESSQAGSDFNRAGSMVLTNDTDSYDVKYYDQIMLETYSALNAWHIGDTDNARMYFNRAHQAQAIAINDNKQKISELEKDVTKENLNFSISEAQTKAGRVYSPFSSLKAYKNFANPYTTYLAGLFLLLNHSSSSDVENGLNYLKRAQGMMPKNSFIKRDITLAEDMANTHQIPANVWILYETGLAPSIDKQTVNIPLYYGTGLRIATLSLPVISPKQGLPSQLLITGGNNKRPLSPQLIADMDSIMATELNERMPREVAKAILWLAGNLAVQEGVNQAFKNSDVKFIGSVAGLLASQITNPTETRTWNSLPKQMFIASFPMPENRQIKISIAGSAFPGQIITFNKSAKYAIVYLRLPTTTASVGTVVSEFN